MHSEGSHGHNSAKSDKSIDTSKMDFKQAYNSFKRTNQKVIDLNNNKYSKIIQNEQSST